ncbi:HAMP domain-containing histidine kinase [Halalkalibacterium halodurans]|uniref:sensor histidine kinase n=1 Tax=Halalkalibacterium halodurans TaxID=86665 RepID=UPI001068CE3D|nr:HAMP domain-containing sensor histidine kinase [Halalkalibacterium halodurans]TES57976.1 HAMP domain-containing histidine kinase [Halalkalibacterium halodurans]
MYLFRQAGYINQIVANTRDIKSGHTPQDLPVRGRSALALLAQNINTMKKGMKQSEREQAKSERLKTELITNVSHDLRTPLTSIITYTELLKDADEQERADYIEIIDRKARRLKILIDDLFEASKMSSGNIELTLETVDVLQLLQQALAEYGEALEQSSLQLRISVPEEPLYIKADGQKIWRVFDNLIQNILKYSLEHTRVYLSVKEKKETVEIIIKNIAKYELGDNVDELLERFKRGDQSRNTEGSGLGLAIAKSIVDLHEGYLDIDVDGDLFKVIIQLPMTN